jgi:hypothetical protein
MPEPSGTSVEGLAEVVGTNLLPERLTLNLVAYRDIVAEIRKLRELDLTDIHPVVVFDVAAAFDGGLE